MTLYHYFVSYMPAQSAHVTLLTMEVIRSAPVANWADTIELTDWLRAKHGRPVGLVSFSLLSTEEIPDKQTTVVAR